MLDDAPPVALLLYVPDQPRRAVYYPFALFSPEWQALRWAARTKVPVRFIDLPMVQVAITQAGASPAELEAQVTKKVEDKSAYIVKTDKPEGFVAVGIYR